ncbi:MAG: AFG1 family ATPase [Hyphomicrobiaceae bacterium]|nr:AFG1 family ATPase [Hyphomicrobiaceae bacterium]
MKNGPLAQYRALIASGELRTDPAQAFAAEQLQVLANRLRDWESSSGMVVLDLLLGRKTGVPHGLYLFGDVGRGKTMLMDLFFETVDFPHKKRLHFHPFMREVHGLIKEMRASKEGGDPIALVADELMCKTRLLCLDELHVNDITDAMILGRLFAALFERDLVVVATSNAAPDELYKNGLNRQLFLPFIELVNEKMDVLQLDAQLDYRRDKFQNTPHYFTPADDAARRQLDEIWTHLAGGVAPHDGGLDVGGRRIVIPRMGGGMARFSFDDLCGQPLGANDYLALCEHFHTFFIDDIPQLTRDRPGEARRFIKLIDTLYDQKRRLIVSCMVEPDEIYKEGLGADEFARTSSRLTEMRQSDWPGEG